MKKLKQTDVLKEKKSSNTKLVERISEQEFKNLCLTKFPLYIRIDGIAYRQVTMMTVHYTYEFFYVAWDGRACNWKINTACEFREDDYKDLIHYVSNFLSHTPHEFLTEVLTREDEFRRELACLLNRYSKENECGDTPDFILASYLINCLKAFGSAVSKRTDWYKK